jgi:hypothetical protein
MNCRSVKGDGVRCLFCKGDAATSRSEEHVIPAALGNTKLVLAPGLVCDSCNQYFAVKIEKPLMEQGRFRDLRSRQGLRSRRGRPLPHRVDLDGCAFPVQALLAETACIIWPERVSDIPALHRSLEETPDRSFTFRDEPSVDVRLLSRLLAKAALEHMAHESHGVPGWERYAWGDEFNGLRDWAREGRGPTWPISQRRLYDEQLQFIRADGDLRQTIWEAQFYKIEPDGHYWVAALFGVEYAINIYMPEIANFRAWLRAAEGLSPLYAFRQGADQGVPRGFTGQAQT